MVGGGWSQKITWPEQKHMGRRVLVEDEAEKDCMPC
jgi:hypothetical protein